MAIRADTAYQDPSRLAVRCRGPDGGYRSLAGAVAVQIDDEIVSIDRVQAGVTGLEDSLCEVAERAQRACRDERPSAGPGAVRRM